MHLQQRNVLCLKYFSCQPRKLLKRTISEVKNRTERWRNDGNSGESKLKKERIRKPKSSRVTKINQKIATDEWKKQ